MTIDPDLHAPAHARRALAAAFPELTDRVRDDAMIVVSELVTNAVLSGAGELRIRFASDGRYLRVEIDEDAPGSVRSDWTGLHLVAALAESCGARHTDFGETQWAELAVS